MFSCIYRYHDVGNNVISIQLYIYLNNVKHNIKKMCGKLVFENIEAPRKDFLNINICHELL